jgi:hypothetical protein
MKFLFLCALTLQGVSAKAEQVVCRVIADTWVEAPPWEATASSPASNNHGTGTELVINGRNSFALVQFDLSAAAGLTIDKAVLRVHQQPGITPITVAGISTISGSGPWNEGRQTGGRAEAGSSNYFFAQADRKPWAYAGSDLTDVTFGLGGSLYAYRTAKAADDDWYEIDVPPALVTALITGDQFGWMLTDEKGQTRARHVLSSREGPYPPVLILDGERRDRTPPGPVRSLRNGAGIIQSSPEDVRSLGRTTL